MRLDKYISNAKIGTRREVKALIKSGKVKVNEKIIKKSDYKVTNEIIEVNNNIITPHKKIYIMFNKPKGILSANKDYKRKTVFDLIKHPYVNELSIAGRLDLDVHGLLLLSNDGTFIHKVISPKKNVYKTYEIIFEGVFTEEKKKRLESGIKLNEFTTKPAIVSLLSKNKLELKILEGKFHQVKRMIASIDLKLIDLKRTSIGSLKVDIPEGTYRELKEFEYLSFLK
ncbi:pseudouridine synthase [Tepiditoga spiralis]|uniref:Pseudouridine synthase n=1 Tax=Tepiditoga spiralis TaxID=2108365 RepID=A0A7G1G7F6_9BACT|nr:pseudouridine synthase [Tepiditoga spiralis]BBE32135.1 pseudouridine synthase [Tepiditoga spiralis]